VRVVLLGTAAGGGFPQWNCWCPRCRLARAQPERARPRTQSSVAVSADNVRWFLLNASPDVHRQLATLMQGPPPAGARHVPVEGVVVTDAELDHTLGIVLLREGRRLQLWGTCAALATLECDSRLLPVTRAFAEVAVNELPLETSVPLRYRNGEESGLSVEAFVVPAGPPRFATRDERGHTVGLVVREVDGGTLAYAPACGGLDEELLASLSRSDLVLFDGTFWTDDELIALGIGDRTARQMDHLPLSGPGGSLERLASLPVKQRVYVHINNTNPILVEDSPERFAVEQAGLAVGMDGMQFRI
jgi:pyrroloquinoline quinone biosynthesis protein B